MDLCEGFTKVMNTGAYIITSGYITSQEAEIIQVYASHGFEIINRIQIDDWLSIMFKKK